jgi:hypothetical protein
VDNFRNLDIGSLNPCTNNAKLSFCEDSVELETARTALDCGRNVGVIYDHDVSEYVTGSWVSMGIFISLSVFRIVLKL